MIIVKVINQKVVQVAVAGNQHHINHQFYKPILAQTRKHLLNTNLSHNFVQSTYRQQKVTNANNQYLIPIARNISFRQCRRQTDPTITQKSNAKFSIVSALSSSDPQAHFITNNHHLESSSIFVDEEELEHHHHHQQQQRESPFDVLKRKAKDVVEKRGESAQSKSNKYYGQSFEETVAVSATNSAQKKLVVLMSWLEAKEKHIEKYRQFYLDRGFDVLNVKTSALDLLLPTIGAKKISKDFARFMIEKQYSDVVLHGFSVGGYMFGQVLLDIDKQEQQMREKILKSIKGIVFDSLVPFEGTCVGVANSITSNKFGAKGLELLLRAYLYLGYNIATKYYMEASDKVWGGPLRCPSLFLLSKDDNISDHKIIERLANIWSGFGIEVRKMIVDSSPHVQIFQKHHDKYVNEVETFLNRIKMN